jgi:hypothetical protein
LLLLERGWEYLVDGMEEDEETGEEDIIVG